MYRLLAALGYHDAITPEIQRATLDAEVFWPCEIYYHAPADVRDGLIQALSTEDSSAASNLMCCLVSRAMAGHWKRCWNWRIIPPWRKKLYVDPSILRPVRRLDLRQKGQRIQPNFDTCFPLVKGTPATSPRPHWRARRDTCPTAAGIWWICWCWMAGMSG